MRKSGFVIGVVLLAVSIGISGCGSTQGSGSSNTSTRDVHNFNTIALTVPGTMTVKQTGSESLAITGDSNVVSQITSNVSDNKLVIGTKSGSSINAPSPISYQVTVRSLKELDLDGVGSINATNISTTSLVTFLNGTGKVSVSGQADSQGVSVNGTGTYDGTNFKTMTAATSVRGVGHVRVRVSQTLNAHVNGVGSIEYIGNPHVIQSVNGGGSIDQVRN